MPRSSACIFEEDEYLYKFWIICTQICHRTPAHGTTGIMRDREWVFYPAAV